MEDVDKKQSSSFTTTLRFGVLGEAQWFWGLGGGRGREAVFFRTSLPPLEQRPSVQGRCSAVSDFIGRCEGKFMEIPAKNSN